MKEERKAYTLPIAYDETGILINSIAVLGMLFLQCRYIPVYIDILRREPLALLMLLPLGFLVYGIYLSFSNALVKRYRKKSRKVSLLIFVIVTNYAIAGVTLAMTFNDGSPLLKSAALLNAIYSFIIMIFFRLDLINEENVTSTTLGRGPVWIILAITIATQVLLALVVRLHWTYAIAWSILIAQVCKEIVLKLHRAERMRQGMEKKERL